ncbi:hypothetical protein O0L34_g3449 [Tuta absoluta]|nr:hypothetical protein O0L34_g3449 [Tuta absoluta]
MAPRNEEHSEDWQVNYPEIQMRTAHLYRSREWVDCTFQFQTISSESAGGSNDSLDAHKLVLAMASPVFAAMFYGNVGNQESSVNINDIDLPTFTSLLEYIYTDVTDISDVVSAMKLYKAANKYIVVHLEKLCLDYIFNNLNPSEVCQIYEFACFFDEKTLELKCLELFSTKTQFVLKGSSFRNASVTTLKKIVAMNTLDINSEIDLFNALLEYADNCQKPSVDQNFDQDLVSLSSSINIDLEEQQTTNESDNNNEKSANNSQSCNKTPDETRHILKDVIDQIRFLAMTPENFANICESTSVLSKDEICAIFTNMFSPNSNLPMPEGFSCIREGRTRGAATYRHFVHNVRSMTNGQSEASPLVYVRKLPWRCHVKRVTKKIKKALYDTEEEYLSFYFECQADNLSKDWSCNARIEVCLFSNNPDTTPILLIFQNKFCGNKKCEGRTLMKWSQLKQENSYVINDSIVLEVHFTTEPVQNIDQ